MTSERALALVVRVVWAGLAILMGPGLAAALDDRSRPVQVVASIGLWAVWAVVLCATFVRHPISLTVVRVGGCAAVAAGVASQSFAMMWAALALSVVMWPAVALLNVNGPAYPNERRYPLRPPGPVLLGPLLLAVAVVIGAPTAATLLLAAEQWVLGGVVLVAGVPAAVIGARAVHGLSRRWIVFVPAGVVVHDPQVLADPILFRSPLVAGLGPALADTHAFDLTAGALGLALQVDLNEPVGLALARARRSAAKTVEVTAILVAPTRPGAVVAEATRRRLASRGS